jgi:hypothetical protein
MPLSVLSWTLFPDTVESATLLIRIPSRLSPSTGRPEKETSLPESVIREAFDTLIPTPVVLLTTKRFTVIQLRPEIKNPFVCPLTTTVAPVAAVKTIGAADVPDLGGVTASAYVPVATSTVSPATALDAAAPILQNGCVDVPEPASEQVGLDRFTNSTAASAVLAELPSTANRTMTAAAVLRALLAVALRPAITAVDELVRPGVLAR